jgi:hypothetical protein
VLATWQRNLKAQALLNLLLPFPKFRKDFRRHHGRITEHFLVNMDKPESNVLVVPAHHFQPKAQV